MTLDTTPIETSVTTEAALTGSVAGRTPMQLAFARLRRDRVAVISLAVLVFMVLLAVFAPVIASLVGHPPNHQYRDDGGGLDANALPVGLGTHGFLLGADQDGRDELVRMVYGARISLFVGLVATAIALVIGTTVGMISGFFAGRVDTFLSRVIDIFLSFPFLVTALTLVTLNRKPDGHDRVSNLLIVIVVISFFTWTLFARLVRGQVLALREREFIEAARSLGAGNLRIMVRDVLPNLTAPLLVYVTVQIPLNIVFEATLSFLGAGIKVPTASWGNMLEEANANGLYRVAPWMLLVPGLALLITVLAMNLLGDGLRDALDPRAARTLARKKV